MFNILITFLIFNNFEKKYKFHFQITLPKVKKRQYFGGFRLILLIQIYDG